MATVIPQEIKETIAFIFANKDGKPIPIGTGFFAGVVREGESTGYSYLVTSKHVIDGLEEVWLRLNLKEFDPARDQIGYQYVRVPIRNEKGQSLWFYHSDPAVDVALLPYAPHEPVSWKVITTDLFMTKDIFLKEDISEGDEVFFVGLLPQYYETKRNYPVVRHGRIALIPREKVKIEHKLVELYFIEAQSFPGNSGSPVFLRFGPTRKPNVITIGPDRIFLLGVMKGYFFEVQNLLLAGQDISMVEAEQKRLLCYKENIGIAAIEPVDRIREVLFSERLIEREARFRKERQETP